MNLIFIYNANSGFANSALDSLHKAFSPKTYQCSLCSLTHGVFKEKKEWSEFLNESEHTYEFLHKDDPIVIGFEEQFPQKFGYPCVLKQNDSKLKVHISSEEMNKLENLDELIKLIEEKTK